MLSAVPWLRPSVFDRLPQKHGFVLKPMRVGFVVHEVALGERVFSECFNFTPSASFHKYSKLVSRVHM